MKPFTLKSALELVKEWKDNGEKVVFTNGVFDILHLGHVTYLEAAKAEGDRLVLGLNSDESVRRLNKGPERPINPEHARAGVLMALKAIDAVVVFGDDTPLALINALKPDVLVKGGDYDPNETDPSKKTYMVGSTEVRALGGEVVAIPLVDGFSTTNIVRRMRD
ncbi:MAG: D-glycero-beta-D-manno-heptose 1-phosphate adenylyltransferase [Flavobacteriales bacterium]|jgi:D-glycero-beta-D-manno-heptose 1-phosphate adenylyltransferase|nr:D-glycero-beta-D-manno-heptose 1-phosphate adenylyltransferase [Flavobacteriales bacterium]MDP4952061.1 D-glycero-beta-D-manno-heptose 1-phosphate adenylyltransferase [Flavobacteriales bacterium]